MKNLPIVLRAAPPMGEDPKPGLPVRVKGLASRSALYLFTTADAGADGDTFGLGAAIVACGALIAQAVVIVPDDLGERDPVALAEVERWAATQRFDGLAGRASWRVVTLAEFTDPKATVEDQPWAFQPAAYSTSGAVTVGADLGRTLSLMAEHVVARKGTHAGKWEVFLPGWGKRYEAGSNVSTTLPHRPGLRVEHRRVGWQVSFGPRERGNGQKGRKDFVDLLSLAYVLDGDRAAGFVEHARNAGVTAEELPIVAPVDAVGAAQVAQALDDIRALALALDDKAAGWFTTSVDRQDGIRRIDLARSSSPAALATMIPARFSATPPLTKFHLTHGEHQRWFESFHGGWADGDERLWRRPFQAVYADLSSAFPLVAHHVGWWSLRIADHLGREIVTADLKRLCARAIADPTVVLDPATWQRFGITRAEVVPQGEPWYVDVDDPTRPDGRCVTVPLVAEGRTANYSWFDVVGAAVRARRVPEIVRAVRLVPVGREFGLRRRVPVLPELVCNLDDDPAADLVRRRRQAKEGGDSVLSAQLHALVNALVSGNPSRLDSRLRRVSGTLTVAEQPGGTEHFMPVAATVQAGARMLLAVLDRLVTDLGGTVAYRNTDSSIIPASPGGGTLTLPDGSTIHQLAWSEVDGVLGAFERLAPEPAWPVWKTERGADDNPLRCLVFGQQRHVEYVLKPDGPELIDWTESGLGGRWSDPAGMPGRCLDGGRAWSRAAVLREVVYAEALVVQPKDAIRDTAPWDTSGAVRFPALRRLQVTTPTIKATLPEQLGAQLGSRFLEGSVSTLRDQSVHSVVALDPGGDLAGWETLRWLDRATGMPVRVTTSSLDTDRPDPVLLESLSARAAAFARQLPSAPVDSAVLTPLSVQYRGRVSGVLDAGDGGEPEDVIREERPEYVDIYGFGPGQRKALFALVKELGASEFARQTGCTPRTARKLAAGKLPTPATVRRILAVVRTRECEGPRRPTCALDGCSRPIPKGARKYCSPAHSDRAWRSRTKDPGRRPLARPRRAAVDLVTEPGCPGCGAVLLGAAATGPCPVCSYPSTKAS